MPSPNPAPNPEPIPNQVVLGLLQMRFGTERAPQVLLPSSILTCLSRLTLALTLPLTSAVLAVAMLTTSDYAHYQ